MRLVIYLILFVASLGAVVGGLGRSAQRQWILRLVLLAAGCAGVAATLGGLIGWATSIKYAPIWCGIGFGLAGAMSGLAVWLYLVGQATAGEDGGKQDGSMSRFTLIALVAGSFAGALVGTWIAMVGQLDEGLLWCPAGTIFGTLVGACTGLVYERPRALLLIVGFLGAGGVAALFIAWLNKHSERGDSVPALASPVQQPSLLDQMYDRDELLRQLFDDDVEGAFAALTTLWLLSDGGPRFQQAGSPESPTLRSAMRGEAPLVGTWVADVEHEGRGRRFEFEFPSAVDESQEGVTFWFRVVPGDGEVLEAEGEMNLEDTVLNLRLGETSFSQML